MDRNGVLRKAARAAAIGAVALAAAVVLAGGASAQTFRPPVPSPAAEVSLEVGTTKIEVSYHRPALRGRDVWKDFGSTDLVWRLGANDATTISFGDPVTIAGKEVPAGTYALFAKVGKDPAAPWTLLLNKNAKQWGAYFHDDGQDLLRFEVKPVAIPKREWFAIALDPKDADTATLSVAWDTVQVSFDIDVDVDGMVTRSIERALKELEPKDWRTRFVVAKYWIERGMELEEARVLIEEAVALDPNFWTLEWNARALHALDETESALPLLERAMAAAKGRAPDEYVQGLERLRAEWQAKRP